MSLRVAIQTDPLETAMVESNTTFALAEAAQKIGAELFEYQPENLSYREGRITAFARPMTVQRVPGTPALFKDRMTLDLRDDVDVVLMRQDPPFDMAYITACHLLELLAPDTLVMNDPTHVRSGPEKLYPLLVPDFLPPTLISRDTAEIEAFRADHKDVIVKPLYGFGGGDVRAEQPLQQPLEPVLIVGEPVGGFNRVPLKGHARSNLAVGGTAEPSELSDADLAICAAIGPDLKARGQVLVGIDVIGGRLTEVNNTSPTGVQQVRDFTGRDPAAMFWEVVQDKLANT